MPVPLFVIGAGIALQAMGQLQANRDQANAERQNASFFREEAEFTREATFRELKLFNAKAVGSFGDTVGAYTSSGVQLSASALEVLAGEKTNMQEQANAIEREGQFKARLAMLRAEQADRTADSLTSPLSTISTIAGGALRFAGAAQ